MEDTSMTFNEKQKKEEIKGRTLAEAEFMIRTHATVRETAKETFQFTTEVFGREIARSSKVSKSTVHDDMTVKLYYISKPLWKAVGKVLAENGEESLTRANKARARLGL